MEPKSTGPGPAGPTTVEPEGFKGHGWLVLGVVASFAALTACMFLLDGDDKVWVLIAFLLVANAAILLFLRSRRSVPQPHTPPRPIPRVWWLFAGVSLAGAAFIPVSLAVGWPDLTWIGFVLIGVGLVGRLLVSMNQQHDWKGRLYYVAMIGGFIGLVAGMFGGVGWAFWLGFAWLASSVVTAIVIWLNEARTKRNAEELRQTDVRR